MDEFIQMAMKQLGTNESMTRSITGKVLGFIKEKAGGDLVGRILGQVPDLNKLVG